MSETTTAQGQPGAASDADVDAWVRAAPAGQPAPQQPNQRFSTESDNRRNSPTGEPEPPPATEPENQPDPSTEGEGEGEPRQELTEEDRAERKRLAIEAREARRAARQAADERDRYQAELARQQQNGGQETEEQRIDRRARELIAEREQNVAVQKFNERCNEIYDAGVKELGDEFKDAVEELNSLRLMPPALIEAADEAGDPHRILAYLGQHPDEARRIAQMTPWRMGAAVAKIAAQAKAPAPRPRSNAPPPVRGVVGSGTARGEPDPDRMSMADFVKWQDEQDAKRAGYR